MEGIIMKDKDGFTLLRNKDGHSEYLRREYLVDGYNVQGDPDAGLWDMYEIDTCRTMKEAKDVVRQYKDKYDKIEVWQQLVEADIDKYGWTHTYSTIGQSVYTFIKGKQVKKETLL